MKVVVMGANGQLGTDICRVFKNQARGAITLIPLTRKDLDVTDFAKLRQCLTEIKPDVVINTTAYHRVDECEDNPQMSFLVNTIAVEKMCSICQQIGAIFVHFSTDFVFDGAKGAPYDEYDQPNPQSIYALSKYAGELIIKIRCQRAYIFRVASLYGVAGSSGKGGNFVETVVSKAKKGETLRIVNDLVMSPTYTLDCARKVYQILQNNPPYGVYHLTNSHYCTWFEFAQEILRQIKVEANIVQISIADMGRKAKRPPFSALKSIRLSEAGIGQMRPWWEALKDYLIEKNYLGGEGFEPTTS